MLFPAKFNIWLSIEPCDMRKAVNGLTVLVLSKFKLEPQKDGLFIFYNKKRDLIKILYWHYNGFCLLQKRIEKGSFKIPTKVDPNFSLNQHQLSRLFEGLHFITENHHKYDTFF